MRRWLALDLSLSSTGWASWADGDAAPAFGHWVLSDMGMQYRARGYVRLHRQLLQLNADVPITHVSFEEPLSQASVKGGSSLETIQMLAGLAAHAESFAAAIRVPARAVNVASWRKHFIGSVPRGTKSPDLKAMTIKRCRELGMDPARNDEADAIGILDFVLSSEGLLPPWRADHVLVRPLHPSTDGRAAAA
jgi:hypothetical protein